MDKWPYVGHLRIYFFSRVVHFSFFLNSSSGTWVAEASQTLICTEETLQMCKTCLESCLRACTICIYQSLYADHFLRNRKLRKPIESHFWIQSSSCLPNILLPMNLCIQFFCSRESLDLKLKYKSKHEYFIA
jgi:hypothetical protein